jgi:hypothetical protein
MRLALASVLIEDGHGCPVPLQVQCVAEMEGLADFCGGYAGVYG